MRFQIRPSILLVTAPLLLTLCPAVPALASSSFDETLPDAQTLLQLEQRAEQANPRDQCFLYTQLVHTMTELAGKEMLDGDVTAASATLKQVEKYAMLIHMGLSRDTKRLKNAEMLMHHTTYRLNEYLHITAGDDHDTLQATLKQLNQVQDEILNQVFSH
jgi:hypothetical protein